MAKVKMFGTGNHQIGEKLYVFRDGESINVDAKDVEAMKAEAERRRKNDERVNQLSKEQAFDANI